MAEPLLTIRKLSIATGDPASPSLILDGIDLELKRGQILGLIGESGAGKSTLGLSALGVVKPGCRIAGGSVVFAGEDLMQASEARRRALRGTRIAYVAQSAAAAFNPAHRLGQQIVEAPLAHRLAARRTLMPRAVDLLHRLRLPSAELFARRFPHQASGGQLQRAMTAMGMIADPDLIVFDEPTTALDVTTQVGVLIAIKQAVMESGAAALYISHDLALVAQMADRIMVLRHGRLVEEAATATMLAAPKEAYTRSLWSVRQLAHQARPPGPPLFEARGIDAFFGDFRVLDRVSIAVAAGRTVAIVGESGSGKSTLARVLAGLKPPSAGTLTFAGKPLPGALRKRDRTLLQRIQMVYQSSDTALNPRHKVRKLLSRPLAFYRGLRGAKLEEELTRLMASVELQPALLERRPVELSGGQKQRVAIARALAAQPEVMICDEITSALDQLVQESILKLLQRLQAETKLALIFITHDLATVRAIADDIVVMHRGRVVEQGPRDTVLSPPHAPYTAELLAAVPSMDPDWLKQRMAEEKAGAVRQVEPAAAIMV